jgi:DNA-binding response OmpR family regulator
MYDKPEGRGTAGVTLGRVLVVDDDPAMRRACARMLGAEGWTVIAAENGRIATEAVAASKDELDCVVSDVNMPELDGFGLIAALREHDDDLPVLLMTGDPSLDGAVRAIEQGAVSYLAKPFDQEQLVAAVARAARRHGMARIRRRAESFARALGGDGDELARRFQRALDQLWMAFQPIVDVRSGRAYAYEALVRTDEDSMRRPDVLIATAERLGRVHELGRAVRAAIAAAAPAAPAPRGSAARWSAARAAPRCCAGSATGSRSMISAPATPRSRRSRRSSPRSSSSTCR